MFGNFFYWEMFFGLIVIILLDFLSKKFKKLDYKSKRIELIDVLKGIAILLIITIHASDIFDTPTLIKEALWFALPIFVILSGYLLTLRYKEIDLKKYFKNVLKRIVLIYFLFVVFFSILHKTTINDFFLDFVLGRTNNNYYFIPIIFQLYLLFPLLLKLKKRLFKPMIFFIVYVYSLFFQLLNHVLQFPEWNSNMLSLIFFGRFFVFFYFGMYLSNFDFEKTKIKKYLALILLYLSGSIYFSIKYGKIHTSFTYPIVMFFGLVILEKAVSKIKIIKKILIDLGKNTLVIYLIHGELMYNVFMPVFSKNVIGFFSVIFITTITSYYISKIFVKSYNFILKII